jgi:hypothetical protein
LLVATSEISSWSILKSAGSGPCSLRKLQSAVVSVTSVYCPVSPRLTGCYVVPNCTSASIISCCWLAYTRRWGRCRRICRWFRSRCRSWRRVCHYRLSLRQRPIRQLFTVRRNTYRITCINYVWILDTSALAS